MSDYFPTREVDLKTFVLNVGAQTVAGPTIYGVPPAVATEIEAAAQAYAAALDTALTPSTRTRVTIVQKNEAKAAVVALLRRYLRQIKADVAVSNDAKVALGLPLPDAQVNPIEAPQTRPNVTVVSIDFRQHTLRFRDPLNPDAPVKPAGVQGVQLLCHVGEAPPEEPAAAVFRTFVSNLRTMCKIDFAAGDVGKRAWYFARWQTAAGRFGPWSLPVSRVVAE